LDLLPLGDAPGGPALYHISVMADRPLAEVGNFLPSGHHDGPGQHVVDAATPVVDQDREEAGE
jgi:hypothetical protein